MKTAEQVAEDLLGDGDIVYFRLVQALTAYAEERVKEHEEELICEDCGYAGSRVKASLEEPRAGGAGRGHRRFRNIS